MLIGLIGLHNKKRIEQDVKGNGSWDLSLGLILKRLALGNNHQHPMSCLRSGLDVAMNHLSRRDLGEPNQLQHVAAREPS